MPNHLKIFFSKSDYLATAAGFFLLGFLFGNWASLIPYIKATFSLNDASLGLLLLCLPLGAMSFNPIAARLIQLFGQKRVTIFAIFFISFVYLMPFLAICRHPYWRDCTHSLSCPLVTVCLVPA